MKNKFILVLLLALFNFTACSNLSKNYVQEGRLYVRNGAYADKIWKDHLIFDRYSWYHELTMQFDLMVTRVIPQSAFNFWFSKEELSTMMNCYDSRVVLAYSLDTKDIPYSSLYEQVEKAGYVRLDLTEFKKQVLQHPDSQANGFRLYHIFGICKKSNDGKSLIINLPGYLEKQVK